MGDSAHDKEDLPSDRALFGGVEPSINILEGRGRILKKYSLHWL